jgi:hypothetical protein
MYPREHAWGPPNEVQRLLKFKTKLDVPEGQVFIGDGDGERRKTLSGQSKPADDCTDTHKNEGYQHDDLNFGCTFIESCRINFQSGLVLSKYSTRALATQP